jgi:hypothetical protein
MKIMKSIIVLCAVLMFLTGCQSYQRKVVPAKMPDAYPNMTNIAGADIAVKLFDDQQEAQEAFGFDIRGAGILPVQVIINNKGTHPVEIVPGKTILIDTDNNIWQILDTNLTYDRIAKKTDLGKVAPEAVKGGFLAGIGGALVGAAIGIVTGQNVGMAAGQGAAIGAATGAVIGGAKGYLNGDVKAQIREDLQKHTLENRAIAPKEIAHGFVFFPGEAAKVKELRLGVEETDTDETYQLIMNF